MEPVGHHEPFTWKTAARWVVRSEEGDNDGFDLSNWSFDNVQNNNPWQGTGFQSSIGDASISRRTIDGFMGQVYLNTQTFSGQYQPTAISLYATNAGHYITPIVFAVNQTSNGVSYTLEAVYQPIHIDQAGQTTKPLSLLAGARSIGTTTYVFGYTDQQLASEQWNGLDLGKSLLRGRSITRTPATPATGWRRKQGADSPVGLTSVRRRSAQTPANSVVTAFSNRIYSASIILGTNQLQGVVTQQVGDPPINHSQTDTFVGQVYIDSQTFSGTLNPSSISFYANQAVQLLYAARLFGEQRRLHAGGRLPIVPGHADRTRQRSA